MYNISRYSKLCLAISATLVLGACGYAVESSNQDITFLTPGAHDAKCYVYVDKLKYQVFPPQKLNIKKSDKDMEIICYAPGNRKIELDVPAEFTARAIWGGPVGMAWDYASQSLFHYPSVIAIDFNQEKVLPNPLPQHNNPDIDQPETYDLEEFKASTPRLNSDKYKVVEPIILRGADDRWNENPEISDDAPQSSSENDLPPKPTNKVSLTSIIESLSKEVDTSDPASTSTQDIETQAGNGGDEAMDASPEVTPSAPSDPAMDAQAAEGAVSEPVQLYPSP